MLACREPMEPVRPKLHVSIATCEPFEIDNNHLTSGYIGEPLLQGSKVKPSSSGHVLTSQQSIVSYPCSQ